MKKIVRLLSLMLLAALLFSVTGGSACAANGAVLIGDDDKLSVSVEFNSLTKADYEKYQASITPAAPAAPAADIVVDNAGGPAGDDPDEGDEFDDDDDLDKSGTPGEGGADDRGSSGDSPSGNLTPVLPKCRITVVSGDNETVLEEGAEFPFPALFAEGMELRITPPDEYYVSGLTLTNGSEPAAANSLLRAAYAASGGSTALILKFGELKASGEGLLLDGSWLSGTGPDESYTLSVSCDTTEDMTAPVIEYRAGAINLPEGTVLVEGGNTFTAKSHGVLYPLTSVLAAAYQQGKEFNGYLMSYESGPKVRVSENDLLVPFGNVVLTAQWKDATIPHFTITAESDTREYNGSPLKVETYKVEPNPADYHYTLSDVVVSGEVTFPDEGEKENRIVSFKLTDPFGNQVSDQALAQMVDKVSGKLRVTQRSLTISAVTCELATNGEKKTASQITTSDGYYVNGYHQEGLLSDIHEFAGDVVTGSGTTTFKTEISNKLRVRVKGTNEDVTKYYNITRVDGLVTITDVSPDTDPTVHDVVVTLKSGTWTYDGKAHRQPEYEVSGLVDGDKISKVNFKSTAVITDVGTATNDIDSVEIVSSDGKPVPKEKYNVTSNSAVLKVTSRNLTVTAISGSLTTTGGEIVASKLESPDHEYQYGYKAEGLASGHKLSGSFVQGKGTSGFQTWIDLNKLQVLDGSNNDVTSNYSVHTVDGYITINISNNGNASQQAKVYITITAKSGSFVYDGNAHSMNEYTVSGLVDGDKIDKVTFKPTSVITNVGTQANEIQSAVIKTASGAAVDSSKYSITYVPGKLTVTKFPLTLTAVSDAKTYDGKALNNKSVKSTALANSDHKLSADYEVYDSNGNSIKNGPVDVGVYVKKVSNVKITSGATDVTSNYEITTEDGTLTIRTASGGTSANSVTNTAYYGNTYTIRSDAPYSEFQYLLIDGQKISTDNYTVKEGSTVITLKASFIQSLKTGNHNYSIVSTSKQADGTFNVAKAPKTSDGTTSALWIILLAAAAIALAVAFFFLKNSPKRDRKKPAGGRNSKVSKGSSAGKAAAAGAAAGTAAQFGRQRAAQPKKPVSDTVMDFETFFGADADQRPQKEEEADPTANLVPNFRINLDDYRKPAQDLAAAAPEEPAAAQGTAGAASPVPEAEAVTKPDALPVEPETVPAAEASGHEPAAETPAPDPTISAESVTAEEPASENPANSVEAAPSAPADEAGPAAPSYVGRHEASVQNRDSAASSWYRP